MTQEFHDAEDCQRLREVYARTKSLVADNLEDSDVDPDLLETHLRVERALAFSACGVPSKVEGKSGNPDCREFSEWHETLDDLKLDQSDYIFRDDVAFEETSFDENTRYHFNREATAAQVQIEEQMSEMACDDIPTEKETPTPPLTVECTAMSGEDRKDCLEKYKSRDGARYGYVRE